jgi:hypothetical protein
MKLLPKERKLLLLALNRAVHAGKVDNAAIALVRSLKARFGDGHQLLRELEQPAWSMYSGVDYGQTILPFGKYRDSELKTVPSNYLLRVLNNCANLDQYLHEAIRRLPARQRLTTFPI